MPNEITENQPGSEEEVEEEGTEEGAEGAATEGAEAGAEGKPDKRISDLQSEKDKETARANKLQKLLDAQAGKADPDEGKAEGNDPETTALKQELREVSLDAVFGEFEELRSYGIDRALIAGATRAEMRESATELVSLVKGVASKARNAAMKEFGIKAEQSGATRGTPKNYGSMSDEEFEKEFAKAKNGGASLW